jgi:hypothetical protein
MAKGKKPGRQLTPARKSQNSLTAPAQLLDDLRSLIRQTREGVARGDPIWHSAPRGRDDCKESLGCLSTF